MKILLYGINFAPEPTGIGKYTGELARWLVGKGHDVRVVTATPYYPHWRVFDGYSAGKRALETWHGAEVWRSPLWVPAVPTGRSRVLHLLSFALMSIPALCRQIMWRPDVVWVVAPAFACAPGGWLIARASGAKAWLHVQDFEVDAAFKMGLVSGRLAERVFGALERWMLRRFDRVSSISARMVRRLLDKGVSPSRAISFPNWVDINQIKPLLRPSIYRQELGIADSAVVALFSGTMGGKQGLELLPMAATALRESCPELVFVLCGDGAVKSDIQSQCAGLPNVRFLPLQPDHRLSELLGLADVHLLPQHRDAADLVMPSKLTGMLASGRPVLATAMPGTEIAKVVSQCGLVVEPGDLASFTLALERFASDAALRALLGGKAREFAELSLARDAVLLDFERELRTLAGVPTAGSVKGMAQIMDEELN